MKILHVSTSDGDGGAGRAASRLHRGLRCLGYDSFMFVAKRQSDDPTVIAFEPPTSLRSRVAYRLRRIRIAHSAARYQASRSANMSAFTDDRAGYEEAVTSQLPSCEIVNLHWIARFVDYRSFFMQIPHSIPIFWTLHDMNPFTGGCHYARGCEGYMNGCSACPQLGSSNKDDLSGQIWQRKRESFEKLGPEQLHIVTPSRWLAAKVAHSALLGAFPVTHIPNSVDTQLFSPQDRHSARKALNIPQNARVVLFVAQLLHKRHKGFDLLAEALSGLCDVPNLLLVTVGRGEPVVADHVAHLHLDRLNDDPLLALAYSAADVFAIPSLQDNLPNTVLEAMSCGVPVVGFDVGGIPELVRPGVTGLLAPAGDADALGNAIGQLLHDSAKRTEMSLNCRRVAVKEYALEVQARRYGALYDKLTGSQRFQFWSVPLRTSTTR